jgi:hypothetical protein
MIELFSNFILVSFVEYSRSANNWNNFVVLKINDSNVEEHVKISIEKYMNLNNILIVYTEIDDITFFLSTFTFYACNIKKRKEFEDIMMRNECIFIK